MHFKPHEKVVFVRGGALDWESCDWAAEADLVIGEVYTVQSVGFGMDCNTGAVQNYITLVDGNGYSFSPLHFDPIQ